MKPASTTAKASTTADPQANHLPVNKHLGLNDLHDVTTALTLFAAEAPNSLISAHLGTMNALRESTYGGMSEIDFMEICVLATSGRVTHNSRLHHALQCAKLYPSRVIDGEGDSKEFDSKKFIDTPVRRLSAVISHLQALYTKRMQECEALNTPVTRKYDLGESVHEYKDMHIGNHFPLHSELSLLDPLIPLRKGMFIVDPT